MSAESITLSDAERQRIRSEAYAAGMVAGRGGMLLDLQQSDRQLWEKFFEAFPIGPTVEQVHLVARIAFSQRAIIYAQLSQLIALRESAFLNQTVNPGDDSTPAESVGDICRQLREWLDHRRCSLALLPASTPNPDPSPDVSSPVLPGPVLTAGNLDESFSTRLAAKEARDARQVWNDILSKVPLHHSQ